MTRRRSPARARKQGPCLTLSRGRAVPHPLFFRPPRRALLLTWHHGTARFLFRSATAAFSDANTSFLWLVYRTAAGSDPVTTCWKTRWIDRRVTRMTQHSDHSRRGRAMQSPHLSTGSRIPPPPSSYWVLMNDHIHQPAPSNCVFEVWCVSESCFLVKSIDLGSFIPAFQSHMYSVWWWFICRCQGPRDIIKETFQK
jgi:hypothetical protein